MGRRTLRAGRGCAAPDGAPHRQACDNAGQPVAGHRQPSDCPKRPSPGRVGGSVKPRILSTNEDETRDNIARFTSLGSVREIVLFHQDEPLAEVWRRGTGEWPEDPEMVGGDLVSFPGGEGVDGCVKLPWRLFFRALW